MFATVPPLPAQVFAEVGRVERRSHGRVIVELADRGRVPGGVSVGFHSRGRGVETWGHYVVRHGRLEVRTTAWHFRVPITREGDVSPAAG